MPSSSTTIHQPPVLSFELVEEGDAHRSGSCSAETSTHHDHDSEEDHHPSREMSHSSTSSICSFSTESTTPSKLPKRVRFEESVSWSYFEVASDLPEPPSWPQSPGPTRSKRSFWQRFRDTKSSSSLSRSSSMDDTPQRASSFSLPHHDSRMPAPDAAATTTTTTSSTTTTWYTSHQPLRETSGPRFDCAATRATWRASTACAKGDWNELLSNPRQSGLVV